MHFVIRALQGPELNYPILEKLVLTFIYAARQLRHYFHAHKIKVLTSYPIKQIRLRPEKLGHLVKWEINIKAQALVDFLVEIPDILKGTSTVMPIDPLEPKVSQDVWELHTNGAASHIRSRFNTQEP